MKACSPTYKKNTSIVVPPKRKEPKVSGYTYEHLTTMLGFLQIVAN